MFHQNFVQFVAELFCFQKKQMTNAAIFLKKEIVTHPHVHHGIALAMISSLCACLMFRNYYDDIRISTLNRIVMISTELSY